MAENVFIWFLSGDGWVQVAPKPNTFMPFGNGVHACPGNELAKLEMLILIHHLMTKFRYASPRCLFYMNICVTVCLNIKLTIELIIN